MLTDTILLIRPNHFAWNEETATSNAFQTTSVSESVSNIRQAVMEEFENMVEQLRQHGLQVLVFDDLPTTPDAIFPNNWFSTHADGQLLTYPMHATNRRLERRPDIVETLKQKYGYTHTDLSQQFEPSEQFLEGTGSLVLDRANRIAYACRSVRTHEVPLNDWGERLGYQMVLFSATDANGLPIYHTNVVMCIGETFAVICLASISNETERETVCRSLEQTGHEIIEISMEQVEQFAGNMLQLRHAKGEKLLLLSAQAYASLEFHQIARLQAHNNRLVVAAIPTIEKYGGGSVRCMVAEVFAGG